MYRWPKGDTLHAVYQEKDTLQFLSDYQQRGFLFAPFDESNNIVVLQPDEIEAYSWEKSEPGDSEIKSLPDTGKELHLNLLGQGISEIHSGRLKKVVLSRKVTVPYTKEVFQIFHALLSKYPNALVYFFHHPKLGTWLGATPERFVEFKDGVVQTTALAGTLPYQEGSSPPWTDKEYEEQQMVTDFLEKTLFRYTKHLEIIGPVSARSGKLWHLKTEVKAKEVDFSTLGEIIKALHPTPAVCGLPKSRAKAFILENENYDREYYTGFLGALNLQGSSSIQLYVNLRCMKLENERAHVFVGGGVTKASEKEKEWRETQYKSRTMLDVLS